MPRDSVKALRAQVEELSLQLEEARGALEAIRTGQVESLVVEGPDGPRIFSLEGASHSYRVLVEAMNEGAATLSEDGTILYCNARFAAMLGAPLEEVMGSSLLERLPHQVRAPIGGLLAEARGGNARGELELRRPDGKELPVQVSISAFHDDGRSLFCLVATDLSERKRNERALAEGRLAHSVLEQAAEVIVVCDEKGRVTQASRIAEQLCGCSPLRASFDAAFPVQLSSPLLASGLASTALSGAVTRSEPATLTRVDGTTADLLVSAAPLQGANGQIVGCVVTLADVSEHRRAQEAERQYAELLRLSDDAIFVWRPGGAIESWSPGAAKLYGFTSDEACGRGSHELLRSVASVPWRLIEELLERSGHWEGELRHTTKDGRELVVLAKLKLIVGDGGQRRVLESNRDISGRKRAEDALRASEARFRIFFETPAVGTAELSLDGRFLEVNDRYCEITGYSRDELLRMGPGELSVPEDSERDRAALASYLKDGRTFYEMTKRYRRKDGRVIWVQVNAAMVRDDDGRPVRSAGVIQDVTERRRAEDELHSAKSRLELALDSGRMGMWEWDVRTNRSVWNSKEYELLGLPAGDGNEPTSAFFSHVHPDDLPEFQRSLDGLMHAGADWSGECRIVRPDGEVRWLAAVGRLQRDPDGRPERMIGVNYDITEAKGAQRQIEQSNQKLNAVLASIQEDFYVLSHAWTFVYASSRFTARIGKEPKDFIGKNIWEMFPEHLGTILEENFRAAMDKRETRSFELGGKYTSAWYRMRAFPSAEGIAVLGTEITEERRLQDALREQELHYRTLFESSPSGIVILKPDGSIHEFNEQAHCQLGYSREEFSRLTLADIDLDESPGTVRAHAESILQRGAALFDARHRAKNGEVRDVVVSARVIEVAGKKRLLCVWRDVTERRRAVEALHEADRNKTQFIAMLSHELRNPLAPIRNSLYILDRAVAGGEQAVRAKAVIERQVGHMARLIDDLLDVTRISRGKIQLAREPLDLQEVVGRTVEDFRPSFESAEIALELDACPDKLPVHGDRTRLAQALGNLLHNASKFTPRGGRVVVSLAKGGDSTSEAVLRVVDDGAGIPVEMLPRLFQPFSQGENTLDRTRGGLGLGLSLVKGLVELHHGSVTVHSEGLGRGAEFAIRIPLQGAGLAVPALSSQPQPRLRRRVLIVEDNQDAAESLRELLELYGHEVAVGHTGPEGVERARAFRPHAVLCDIGLPGMDGYQVARAFRADAILRNTFLVALSGYAMPEDLQRAKDAGFDRHLAKPPDFGALERILAELPAQATRAPSPRDEEAELR